MLLQKVQHYNDLSPKLRTLLEERVKSFGNTVRYKFDIANVNPDPTKHNGPYVWPTIYTLDPTTFSIRDPHEDRESVSKSKMIGIVIGIDNEKGFPNRFKKIRIHGRKQGILPLQLDNEDEFAMAMYLEMHPKLSGGLFSDKSKQQVLSRIDEVSAAKEKKLIRTAKLKALNAAQVMSDADRIKFADAMQWDSSEKQEILSNMIEELAETDPIFFNDLVEGKSIEYRAVVQRAINKKVIGFDPAEWKIFWSSNNQPITVLSPSGEKSYVEKFAEWLQIGGKTAQSVHEKIKEAIK